MVNVRRVWRSTLGKLELAYPTLMGSGCYGSRRGVRAVHRPREDRRDRAQERHAPAATRQPDAAPRADAGRHAQRDRAAESGHRLVSRTRTSQVCRTGRARSSAASPDSPSTITPYVCERLAARDEIDAIELNISCPNVASEGETFACDPDLTAKRRRSGARDDRQDADRQALAERHRHRRRRARGGSRRRRCARRDQHGARDGDRRRNVAAALRQRDRRPLGARRFGRSRCSRSTRSRAPCGFRSSVRAGSKDVTDALEFFLAGATAVSIGTANFTDPRIPERIVDELRAYLARRGLSRRIGEIVGKANVGFATRRSIRRR